MINNIWECTFGRFYEYIVFIHMPGNHQRTAEKQSSGNTQGIVVSCQPMKINDLYEVRFNKMYYRAVQQVVQQEQKIWQHKSLYACTL